MILKKIQTALSKAFASCNEPIDPQHLEALLQEVERITQTTSPTFSVEAVQDAAERALMANGHYEVAKNYILYRQRHAECRNARQFIVERTALPDLEPVLTNISRDFPQMEYDLTVLFDKIPSVLDSR